MIMNLINIYFQIQLKNVKNFINFMMNYQKIIVEIHKMI